VDLVVATARFRRYEATCEESGRQPSGRGATASKPSYKRDGAGLTRTRLESLSRPASARGSDTDLAPR